MTNVKLVRGAAALLAIAMASALSACDDGGASGRGTLSVLLEAEEVITKGLDPGDAADDIADGWQVRFDEYLLAIGRIELRNATDPDLRERNDDVFVVDLEKVPAAGLVLWELPELRAGRWELRYQTPNAGGSALRDPSVSDADFARMQDEQLGYLVRGTLDQEGGRSCPPHTLAKPPAGLAPLGESAAGDSCYANSFIAFELPASAPTAFGPCEIDGVSGVSVPSGGATTAALTIHGDHLFFNGFPEGAEGGTTRYAQWLADCDLDLDGQVTKDELERIAPSALPELDDRFQLGGAPITPLDTMWTYVLGQLKTQGHFQGEGECPIDGE